MHEVTATQWELFLAQLEPALTAFLQPSARFRMAPNNNWALRLPVVGKGEVYNFLYLNILLFCIILFWKRKTEKSVTGGKRPKDLGR